MRGIGVGVAAVTGTAGAVTLPWSDIFSGILGAGGIPPALFLMIVGGLVAVVLAMWHTIREERKARDADRQARDVERENAAAKAHEIQEKRIAEGREMLLALERTAAALTTHTAALESRTVTLNELVKGVENFARNEEVNRKYFEQLGMRLEAGISGNSKALGDLLRELAEVKRGA